MSERSPWFTPESAKRTLPLVSRIVAELIELKRDRAGMDALVGNLAAEGAADVAAETVRRARQLAADLAARIDACHEELAMVGCRMRDVAQGLVDFPAERDGHEVLLSWQLGETDVAYWFDIDPRDTERHPLDELFSVQESS